MRAILLGTATALVLAGSASLAAAGQLSLTSTQMQSIYHSLASEKGQTAPFNFQPQVGAKVPGSLAMHPLPEALQDWHMSIYHKHVKAWAAQGAIKQDPVF